jgi:enoyl-CoA hydratase/carnithine racemase
VTFATLELEVIGQAARITFNRPQRANALNQRMLLEIGQALEEVEGRTEVRVIIVRGAGAAFSSGFDLKEQMERRPTGEAQWGPILRRDFDTVMRFWHCPKPTIAAVRGPCLAGACELAMACDLTIASEDAFFGEPELKFGAGIVVMILPWLVGPKLAKEIILMGADRISAQRAYEIGIVNRIVAAEDLDRAALQMAQHIGHRSRARQADEARNQRGLAGAGHVGGAGNCAGDRPRHRRQGIGRQDAVHGDCSPGWTEGGPSLARCALSPIVSWRGPEDP